MRIPDSLKRLANFIWVALLKIQRTIMMVALCFCLLTIFLEVIMRYILQTSIIGIEELAAYVAFWLYMIGSSYGSYERSQIRAELTHLVFKDPRKYAIAKSVVNLLTFLIICNALPWAYRYLEWGFKRQEQSSATLFGSTYPVVYFQMSISIGLTLMAFYSLVETLQWSIPVLRRQPVPEEMYWARKEIDRWI